MSILNLTLWPNLGSIKSLLNYYSGAHIGGRCLEGGRGGDCVRTGHHRLRQREGERRLQEDPWADSVPGERAEEHLRKTAAQRDEAVGRKGGREFIELILHYEIYRLKDCRRYQIQRLTFRFKLDGRIDFPERGVWPGKKPLRTLAGIASKADLQTVGLHSVFSRVFHGEG